MKFARIKIASYMSLNCLSQHSHQSGAHTQATGTQQQQLTKLSLYLLLDIAMPEPDPCKPEACAIQNCLQGNNYNESKCTKIIDNLYLCCKNFYELQGRDASSVCCPKFSLLQLKLKQRELGKIDAEMIELRHG